MKSAKEVLAAPRYLCDFETYSELDLRDVGAKVYSEHPSTEILCLGYKWKQHGKIAKPTGLWTPDQPFPKEIIEHVEQGLPVEAHNCMFEYYIWLNVLSRQFGVSVPRRWMDTMASCAYRSLPLKLDQVGTVLKLDIVKDKEGKAILNKVSKPQRLTKKRRDPKNRDPELMQRLYAYCIQDVEAESLLGDKIGDLPIDEYLVWWMDFKINTRGVTIDIDSVLAALSILEEFSSELEQELQEITGGAVGSSGEVAKILEWCESQGVMVPNLQAATVDDFVEGRAYELPPTVHRVLEIRRTLAKASTKKLVKMRDCLSSSGKACGLLQYHGAGTGRWAGRLIQPQNFPRGFLKPAQMEHVIELLRTGSRDLIEIFYGSITNVISSMLRGMMIASPGKVFYVADFSAIEARVVMWLAGQANAIEAFHKYDRKEGPDIYCFMAGLIYDRPIDKEKDPEERQLGKITILGCGYQMSGPRLREQAEQSYKVILTEETANMLVKKFREQYPDVVQLWRNLEDAAIHAVKHKTTATVRNASGVEIQFAYETDAAGDWLTMRLPSRRKLWYYNPGTEKVTIQYEDKQTKEIKTFEKDALFYYGRNNKTGGSWSRVYSYGGMLTENAVQAISRDLMVSSMRRVEPVGYEIILTVHDELVTEKDAGTGSLEEFVKLVSGPLPAWAKGCPVAAEGWTGTRYRK